MTAKQIVKVITDIKRIHPDYKIEYISENLLSNYHSCFYFEVDELNLKKEKLDIEFNKKLNKGISTEKSSEGYTPLYITIHGKEKP